MIQYDPAQVLDTVCRLLVRLGAEVDDEYLAGQAASAAELLANIAARTGGLTGSDAENDRLAEMALACRQPDPDLVAAIDAQLDRELGLLRRAPRV